MDLDARIKTYLAQRGNRPASGLDGFLDALIKRRAESPDPALDVRIIDVLDEREHPSPVISTCIRWKLCGDQYEGWTCDRRIKHTGWHADREARMEWEHTPADAAT